jgi:hypothetical protein
MTRKKRILIAIIVASIFQIGYNIYLISNGDTNRAVLDGFSYIFGGLCGYFLFGRKMNKKSE